MKRVFDVVVAFIVLLITSPILLLLSLCIIYFDGFPVFFYQERVGKEMKPFRIIKFRTMKNSNSNNGEVFKGNVHVTQLGAILRRLKLDEIPQLWNVLKGDMSLIGPRPITSVVANNYTTSSRFKVKPGLTGLAQVNGNIFLSRDERFRLDELYVENISIASELMIIIKTFGVVIFGEKRFLK